MKTDNSIEREKIKIRKDIFDKKREIGEEQLSKLSSIIINKLELLPEFQTAKTVLFYYELPFEVQTHKAITKNCETKTIFLPVVSGDNLIIKHYEGENKLTQGSFGVKEPNGKILDDFSLIDLVVVPGVAFDKKKQRMGYGKGFYDRLLPKINAKKVGICFDFQLFETIPTFNFDQSVDIILTELQQVP